MGGRMQNILNGGASINQDTHEFLRTLFGCCFTQGDFFFEFLIFFLKFF
jgi:long-subunit acyl-CoA synthetase (AMP-forming)